MSYTEFLRRKMAGEPVVVNNQRLRTASELTQERRLLAASVFPVSGQAIGSMRGDLSTVETSVNPKQPVSFQKNTGRPKNASDFTAYVGSHTVQNDKAFPTAGKTVNPAACVINASAQIAEPSPYVTGTTTQAKATTVPRSASDYIRERLACQQAQGEQHIASELGRSVFKDDTIRKPEYNKQYLSGATSCAPNVSFPAVDHTHSVTVPRQAWSARPTKSGIPVFNVPSLDYPVPNALNILTLGLLSSVPFSITNAVGSVSAPSSAVLTAVTINSPSAGQTTYTTTSDLTASYVAGMYITISGYTVTTTNNISTPTQIISITSSAIVVSTTTQSTKSETGGIVTAASAPIALSGSTLTVPTGNIPGGTGAGKIDFSQFTSTNYQLSFSTTIASIPSSADANTVEFGFSTNGTSRANYITLARNGTSTVSVTLSGTTATTPSFPTTFNVGDTFGFIASPTTLILTYNGRNYPVTAGFTATTNGGYSLTFDTTGTAVTPSAGFTFTNFSLTSQQYGTSPITLPNCFTGKNTVGVFSRGGVIPSKHPRYVERHHGNDLATMVTGRKPVPGPYHIPAGTPAHLKINDPIGPRTPNM
jgi:hypothetical protein